MRGRHVLRIVRHLLLLRRARGCGSTTAVLYVFSALAISEVEIYVCSLIGTYASTLPPLSPSCSSPAC